MKKIKYTVFCLFCWLISFNASSQVDSTVVSISAHAVMIDPSTARDTLSDGEITERLQVLQNMLEHNEKAANSWWWSWIGIYSSATVVQGLVAMTDDQKLRQDMIVSAGTTLVGFAGQLIFPVKSGYEKESFTQTGHLSKIERLEKLRQAEQLLKYQSERAKSGKNWQTHALNGAVNLAGGLITWLGFKRPLMDGISSFAIGMAISEIQIWSQPTRAMKDYRQYCNQYNQSGYGQATRPQYVWYAHVTPVGLSVGLSF
jgi:hypothetical protein